MFERVSIHRQGLVHLALGSAVRTHRTQAYKLLVGVDADVELLHEGVQSSVRAVLVPPNVPQAIRTPGIAVAFFAEPGSELAPFPSAGASIQVPTGALLERLCVIARELAYAGAHADGAGLADAFRCLTLEGNPRVDRRAERALASVARADDPSLAAVATSLGVSPERLRHLVREATGLSLRRHRLWHRTLDATERMLRGASVARAAADAGFADHPHYSRSFAEFFGRTPSSIDMPATIVASYAPR